MNIEKQREYGKKRWEGISLEERRALMSALGKARWAKVSPEERTELARKWGKKPKVMKNKDLN